MLLKDLITQLQELYSTYDDEYKSVAGEPEIMIDVFSPYGEEMYKYAGFGKDIKIEKSDDGVYDILSTFEQSYVPEAKEIWAPADGEITKMPYIAKTAQPQETWPYPPEDTP